LRSRFELVRSGAFTVLLVVFSCATPVATGQTLSSNPLVQLNFTGITQIGSSIGPVAQMTFGPDGKLYVATFGTGVKRYDYDANGNLSNGITVWSRTASGNQVNGSLGIAFHQDATLGNVMYIAPAVTSSFNVETNIIQSIVRLTDNDNDGNWGEAGEVNQSIVDNLRVTDLHQVNQMLVRDNTLYVGIGSRTRTGGNVSEYPGAANSDDGEFAYTGSINWIRDLTQLTGNTTTANIAGHAITQHHTDTQAFTSANTGKLTAYSTGFRNVYGLAFDGDGELWATMNQNENPLLPDELHQSDFKDDHGFPKKNEVSGDWKLNPTAIGAGYFQTSKTPVALLGNNASADGITFTDINGDFDGHPFIVRFSNGDDLISVDPTTGNVLQIATGFSNPLALLTDPNGQLLLGDYGGGGRIYRIGIVERSGVYGDFDADGLVNSDDWNILKSHFNQTFSGTIPEAYAMGDINADLKVNLLDFGLFKGAYDDANGAGSFAGVDVGVPEPTALATTIAFVLLSSTFSRCRTRAVLFASAHRP
jgi:glucose/arabinose dehydrogenase